MRSSGESLDDRRARIIAEASEFEPLVSALELSRQSMRSHQRSATGFSRIDPTEVQVRMFGGGVVGHLVAVDEATPLLHELQMAVTWIGARLRQRREVPTETEQIGIRKATQLFLRPQLVPGSLIFELVGPDQNPAEYFIPGMEPDPAETILDESVESLLAVLTIAQGDHGEEIGRLGTDLRELGVQVSSALDRLAMAMIKTDIDLDIGWSSPRGRTSSTSLRRRGALAITDAARRTTSEVREVEITGQLETASTGKDRIRIETSDGATYRLDLGDVSAELLGQLLGTRVTAIAEETTKSSGSKPPVPRYRLLSAQSAPPSLPF